MKRSVFIAAMLTICAFTAGAQSQAPQKQEPKKETPAPKAAPVNPDGTTGEPAKPATADEKKRMAISEKGLPAPKSKTKSKETPAPESKK